MRSVTYFKQKCCEVIWNLIAKFGFAHVIPMYRAHAGYMVILPWGRRYLMSCLFKELRELLVDEIGVLLIKLLNKQRTPLSFKSIWRPHVLGCE